MDAQRRDDGAEPAGVQLGTPVPGPLVGQVRPGAVGPWPRRTDAAWQVDGDDFDGAGKLLGGEVPDPGGAVADDDLTRRGVEVAPLRLAMDTSCEGGWLRSVSRLAALSTAAL